MLNRLQRLIFILELTHTCDLLLHLQVPCRNLYYPLMNQGKLMISENVKIVKQKMLQKVVEKNEK